MSPSMTSRTMRWGLNSPTLAIASRPLAAESTVKPWKRRAMPMTSTMFGSSSTTRTRRGSVVWLTASILREFPVSLLRARCGPTGSPTWRSGSRVASGAEAASAAHRVDRGDLEVLVDEDLELGAVCLADVPLVGRAVVGVGLDALDRPAADLRERGRLHLGRGVAGQQGLALAV